jgi:hypothetical protein
MRATSLAIAAALMISVAAPALAAEKRSDPTRSFDTCFALSVQRGAAPGAGNNINSDGQHRAFMRQCLSGEIPR